MTKIMAGLLKAQETLVSDRAGPLLSHIIQARHSPVYAGSGSFPQVGGVLVAWCQGKFLGPPEAPLSQLLGRVLVAAYHHCSSSWTYSTRCQFDKLCDSLPPS